MSFRSSANPNKKKIPAVYDASYYGYDLKIPLVDPRLTGVTTFTGSDAATVHRTTVHNFTPSGTTSVAYTPLLHSTDNILTSNDTYVLYHEGNDTAFDQDYLIEADMTAAVHQIQASFAVALKDTWSDSTDFLLSSVEMTIASYERTATPLFQPYTVKLSPSSVFSAFTASGVHLFIIRATIDIPFRIKQNGPMTLNIKINTAGSAAADTFQVGIVDTYPVGKTSATKRNFASELIAHIHPIPEHMDELNKETDYELEGTGVKKSF